MKPIQGMSTKKMVTEYAETLVVFDRIKKAMALVADVSGANKANIALGDLRQRTHEYAQALSDEIDRRIEKAGA
jgi:hypothetical protein